MKKLIPFIIILLISVLISCNNGMGADSSADSADSSAQVVTDSSKGVVFIDEEGSETVVKTEEDGEEIICKEVIDYVVLNNDEPLSKSSVKAIGRKRAIILGYRSDGCPGLWIVYSGGIVKPVVNSEDIETSELLEMVEGRQPFFKHFGWTYNAVDMAVNGNEIVIAGYAENKEGWWMIEPGTTVGVYWSVYEDSEGYYHISRAKVVGYRDNDWWRNLKKEMKKHGYRYRWRWLRSLRLFFFGWYDRYLTMTESVEVGENPGEYLIKGTDDEGEAAVATVTRWKVLGIEKAPEAPDNNPPYPVTGDKRSPFVSEVITPMYVAGNSNPQYYYLYVKQVDGKDDPDDGDIVTFDSDTLPSYMELDKETGVVTITGAPITTQVIKFWTVDNHGADSSEESLEVTFRFIGS